MEDAEQFWRLTDRQSFVLKGAAVGAGAHRRESRADRSAGVRQRAAHGTGQGHSPVHPRQRRVLLHRARSRVRAALEERLDD